MMKMTDEKKRIDLSKAGWWSPKAPKMVYRPSLLTNPSEKQIEAWYQGGKRLKEYNEWRRSKPKT